jgi:WD40 repeat protein
MQRMALILAATAAHLVLASACSRPLPQEEHTFSRLPDAREMAARGDRAGHPSTLALNERLLQAELSRRLELFVTETEKREPIAGIGFFPGRDDGYVVLRDNTVVYFGKNGEVIPLDHLVPRVDQVIAGGPAGRTIVGLSASGTLGSWNTGNLTQQLVLRDQQTTFRQGQVFDAEFTSDGNLAVAAEDRRLELVSLRSGDLIASTTLPKAQPRVIAPASESGPIVFGTDGGEVALWGRRGVDTLYSHAGPVLDIVLVEPRALIISAAKDGTVKVYDRRTGTILKQLTFPKAVRQIRISPDHKFAVAIPASGRAQIIDLDDMSVETLRGFRNQYVARFVSAGPDNALILGDGNQLQRWNLVTGVATRPFGPPDGSELVDFAVARSYGLAILADENNRISTYDFRTNTPGIVIAESRTPITRIAISDTDAWLIVVLADGQIARMRFDPDPGGVLKLP